MQDAEERLSFYRRDTAAVGIAHARPSTLMRSQPAFPIRPSGIAPYEENRAALGLGRQLDLELFEGMGKNSQIAMSVTKDGAAASPRWTQVRARQKRRFVS